MLLGGLHWGRPSRLLHLLSGQSCNRRLLVSVSLFLLSQQQFDSGAGISPSGEQVQATLPTVHKSRPSLWWASFRSRQATLPGTPVNISLHPPSGFWTTHDSTGWGTNSPLDWGVERLPKGLGSSKRARMRYELGPSAKAGGKGVLGTNSGVPSHNS